eukprot:11201781-Lingulodinium_polyedra.AAC.1
MPSKPRRSAVETMPVSSLTPAKVLRSPMHEVAGVCPRMASFWTCARGRLPRCRLGVVDGPRPQGSRPAAPLLLRRWRLHHRSPAPT